jgi:hypothetical protein
MSRDSESFPAIVDIEIHVKRRYSMYEGFTKLTWASVARKGDAPVSSRETGKGELERKRGKSQRLTKGVGHVSAHSLGRTNVQRPQADEAEKQKKMGALATVARRHTQKRREKLDFSYSCGRATA